jgi:hypothetical protein
MKWIGFMSISKLEKTVTIMLLIILGLSIALRSVSVRRTFAVESFNVDVYWDAGGNYQVTSIDWGELHPSSTRKISIFVRNKVLNPDCFIYLWTEDWIPPEASAFIKLDWNYSGRKVAVGETLPVTLTLKIAPSIYGVDDFRFNITIFGADYVIGDVNGDQVVDIFDAVAIGGSFHTTPSDNQWNPRADLNEDNIIDIFDLVIMARNYGLQYF